MGGVWNTTVILILYLTYMTVESSYSLRNTKPNIIFIMADDLGWNDVGYHNPKVKTPNIDWLASRGIELTDYHAQPTCTPSRSALMTGRYPSNNGLSQLVIQPNSKNCLPLEHKVLPEYMKDLGYATKYVGKWHLGYCDQDCLPTNRGIDEFRGILSGQSGYFDWEDGGTVVRYINDTASTENLGTHLTILDRRDVGEIIGSHNGNKSPLFMMISPTAPHSPLEVTEEMFNVHGNLSENNTDSLGRRRYLGLVSALDDVVGETIRALKDADMFDDSVIIFTSDNGGASINIPIPGFESYGNNYPLRSSKSSFFEGGTKVPTIYLDNRLPRTTSSTKRNFLMHITDWLPTLAQLAGGQRHVGYMDGVSQENNLKRWYHWSKKYFNRRGFLISITDYTTGQKESVCGDADAAFRWRDWKLIHGINTGFLPKNPPTEWVKPAESPELPAIFGDSCYRTDREGNTVARCLFNLKDDPYEQKNLFDTHPNMVWKLLAMINRYKGIRVQNTYSPPLGATNETATPLGDILIPRQGYCEPSIDFPLIPHNTSCDADLRRVLQ